MSFRVALADVRRDTSTVLQCRMRCGDRMIFPERLLPLGADPVPEQELVVGEVYFKVHFADENLLCPTVLPLVFLGKGAAGHQDDLLVFQDESFLVGVSANEGSLYLFSVGDLQGVYLFDIALDIMCRVSLRREKRAPTG